MMKSETDFYRGYFECQRYKMEEQTVPSAGFSPQRDYNVSNGDCGGGYWQAPPQQQQAYFQQNENQNQQQQQQQPPQNHPVLKKSNSGNGQPLDYLADYFDLSLLGDGFEDRDTATVPSPSWPSLGSMEPVQQLSFYAQSPPDYRAFSPECKPLILEASGNNNGGTPSPPPPSAPAPAQNQAQAAAGNYQNAMNDERNNILIRQCLEDQSFLEKYNIKPLNLPMHELDSTMENVVPNGAPGSVGSANLVDDIEPVFTLAYEQIIGDIQQTCRSLGISTDPMSWSTEEVQSWLGYTLQSFVDTATSADQATKAAITGVSGALRTLWNVTGRQLCSFGEEDFRRRDPLYGDKICANLDLLKLGAVSAPPSCASSPGSSLPDDSSGSASATANSPMDSGFDFVGQILLGGSGPGSYGTSSFGSPASSLDSSQSPAPIEVKMEMEELLSVQSIGNPASVETSSSSSSPPSSTSSMRHSDDEEEEEEEQKPAAPGNTGSGNKKAACGTKNGAHIHLWQFLKELLASGQQHGSCIRWLDKQKGVFKIEDSVRVARLWGIRKNRPAMNYDKLSRSIRQYYRKGIMRKTERSQRLVYQFCHPYGL